MSARLDVSMVVGVVVGVVVDNGRYSIGLGSPLLSRECNGNTL